MAVEDVKRLIQARVRAKQYRLSGHAESEREADQITHEEIVDALLSEQCEIVEDYPNDPRGASCLVLGFTRNSKPIHLVCGISLSDVMVVITLYRPSSNEWIDWRKRKEN